MKTYYFFFILLLLANCKKNTEHPSENQRIPDTPKPSTTLSQISHAKGFTVEKQGAITVISVSSPWNESEETFTYALIDKTEMAFTTLPADQYDAIIGVPVEKVVVTSTTHIPVLEMLGVEHTLTAFPNTEFISSQKTRKLIEKGQIKELGKNETINTEVLLDLQPEVVVGFSIDNRNKAYETIRKSNIPVVYNGDWTEQTPLGKAEWIKFFAPFFKKEKEADSIFSSIEKEYENAKKMVQSASNKPTVLAGAMYKDVWYLPAGNSWAAQFLKDANAAYLWEDTEGTGSLSLNFENVLEKGQKADFWIGPSQFVSYKEIEEANQHYMKFKAFKDRKVFTFSLTRGPTGGVLYYELAPNRPDIVLKDLIHIIHPGILPDHQPYFLKPLE
ncbi:ABC transporter substrate-binding protein [Ascidiimonas aurantiaca]|uniref:ABC transporter substrate-binding protein n=1 Tax=Ascidiimonas aurantiaca TaxID=1685432 RepID=UPI0030EB2067